AFPTRIRRDGEFTFVSVFAAENVQLNPPSGTVESSFVDVQLNLLNFCTFEGDFSEGEADNQTFQIGSSSNSAHLTATVSLFSLFDGSFDRDVTVDMAWTATANAQRGMTISHQFGPGGSVIGRNLTRQATAQGSVSDGTEKFHPKTELLCGNAQWLHG